VNSCKHEKRTTLVSERTNKNRVIFFFMFFPLALSIIILQKFF
jgi:hypothetical protein